MPLPLPETLFLRHTLFFLLFLPRHGDTSVVSRWNLVLPPSPPQTTVGGRHQPLPRSPVSITNQPYINTNIEPRSLTLFIISRSEIETETGTEERERKNEGAIVGGIQRQQRCSATSSPPETKRLRSRTRFRPLVRALLRGTRVSRQGHWGKFYSFLSNSLSSPPNSPPIRVRNFRFANRICLIFQFRIVLTSLLCDFCFCFV